MVTSESPVTGHLIQSCYSIIDCIPSSVYYIPMTYFLCTCKIVPLNPSLLFCPFKTADLS